MDSDADLSTAYEAEGKTAKGTAVYEAKTAHAEQTQAELKSFLSDSGVDYKGFWIVNTIAVSGDLDLVGDLAVRTDVARDPASAGDPADRGRTRRGSSGRQQR